MMPQIIFDNLGREEYAVIPYAVYEALKESIDQQCDMLSDGTANIQQDTGVENSFPEPVIKNPITRMRLRANLKQKDLAELLGVTQAYVSKVENADRVSSRAISRVRAVLQAYAVERGERMQREQDSSEAD